MKNKVIEAVSWGVGVLTSLSLPVLIVEEWFFYDRFPPRNEAINGSALISLLGMVYLGGKYYLAKRALSKKQVIPNYNSYYPQQNIETHVEQYQYQEPQSQDYQPQNISNTYTQGTQNSYQQPTDLEARIAQLKSEIQELESN